ncbi:hypothetical protein BT69DRAFT_1342960 [Atractiella rhizophila]|nr:hypothetical protein BT69DRAFT_1342960 [Atractiella rhizophila]
MKSFFSSSSSFVEAAKRRLPSPLRAFIILSLLHFIIQLSLQSAAFALSTNAIPVLRIIEEAPLGTNPNVVQITSEGKNSGLRLLNSSLAGLAKRDRQAEDGIRQQLFGGNLNDTYAVFQFDGNDEPLVVTRQCSIALVEPLRTMRRLQRQIFTFLFYQLWITGTCLVTVLNASVPHLISVLILHALSLAYSLFQAAQMAYFHREFHHEVLTIACEQMWFKPSYLRELYALSQAISVTQALFTILFCLVAWKLYPVLDWNTWHKIGGDRRQSALNKAVLSLKVNLQLSMFFVLTTLGIYLSFLFGQNSLVPRADNELFATDKSVRTIWPIVLTVAAAFFMPWLALGFWVVGGPKNKLSENGRKVMRWIGVESVREWMRSKKRVKGWTLGEGEKAEWKWFNLEQKSGGWKVSRKTGMAVFLFFGVLYM